MKSSKRLLVYALITALFCFCPGAARGNPWNGKVVLQAFWWDCENERYSDWYTYLAKLCPRLRDLGVDGIWIPSPSKGASGGSSMGYDPFDNYDIGNKFQMNTLRTRFGDQDSLLRLIAVAHANGLEVYPDIVLAHCSGGELDPGAPAQMSNRHKKFSYVSAAGAGHGRWPKGWLDFHPNPDHWRNDSNDDWTKSQFGPDVCHRGRCSTAGNAAPGYMREKGREWFVWLTKQLGCDGFRFDAVKHFPPEVVEDFLFNAMGNGREYFAVGEFVGGIDALDRWVLETQSRCGTFDFPLRGALADIVEAGGFFDMGGLPNYQQKNRFKTVPFVNNHDTWRGAFWDSNGNSSLAHDDRWGDYRQNGDELVPTIDPDNARADVAYAAAFAVDGSPQVYYEDLFINHGANRKNADAGSIQTRKYVENLIWCHQKLNFKDGAYKVRFQSSPDLLVIERSGKALIGLNDNGTEVQSAWIQTDFGRNIQLHDYSGNGQDVRTDDNGWVKIEVPAMTYCVWGPAGIDGGFNPQKRRTTQEFQMDDDLGDLRPESLGYGGKLASEYRKAGAIWTAANTEVKVFTYVPEERNIELRFQLPDSAGKKSETSGERKKTITARPQNPEVFSFLTDREGYHVLSARLSNQSGSTRAWLKVEYESPRITTKF